MDWNRRRFLGAAALAAAPIRPLKGQTGRKLLAGAATANITPPLGVAIAGNMTYSPVTEIRDELHVRSLVLDNGQSRLAFAVIDSCMVPRTIIDRAKQLIAEQAGIPPAQVMVSSTHTHSAPAAMHLFQSEADPRYVEWLPQRIADAVRLAVHRLQPARVGWGIGREERLLFCRRFYLKPGTMPPNPFGKTTDRVKMNPGVANAQNIIRPEGPIDPDVAIIAVESLDGRPISVFGNYALHYVGGAGGGQVSADYFAIWANSLARLAGISNTGAYPPFVPILTNACSGHTISFDPRVPQPRFPQGKAQWVADVLAAESYRTWRTLEFHDWVELNASVEELDFGVRMPTAEDVADASNVLAAAPKEGQLKELRQIYARETMIISKTFSPNVKAPVQAMRIGQLGISTFPGETFAEFGLEVKAKSAFKPTMCISIANDARGYIPTPEAHANGGYETWRAKSSYLEVQAGPKMVTSAVRQLSKLA